jgi:UDP-N-acetylmuramoyl-L-alanyl-D-glutamate--2,6-diaminopimelate ligase
MGAVAARLADAIFVTSDNPRTEDPRAIIDEILAGLPTGLRVEVQVEPDRRAAIHAAIASAGTGDVVLLAGKGHETYQQVGGLKFDFDDAVVAREALAARAGRGCAPYHPCYKDGI